MCVGHARRNVRDVFFNQFHLSRVYQPTMQEGMENNSFILNWSALCSYMIYDLHLLFCAVIFYNKNQYDYVFFFRLKLRRGLANPIFTGLGFIGIGYIESQLHIRHWNCINFTLLFVNQISDNP